MRLKFILTSAFFLVFFGSSFSAIAQTNTTSSSVIVRNEKFVIQALRTIHGAEATFQTTNGNGSYGSLAQLGQENLIDSVLATGNKYGYVFTLTTQDRTPSTPAQFTVVAVPRQYRKTGLRSFYLNDNGLIRGADKQGAPATQNDPLIEEFYTCASEAECKTMAVSSLRTIHGAEATYQSTNGNGNFASLCQLREVGFIDERLASGSKSGYYFVVFHRERSSSQPATFEAIAIPRRYSQVTKLSFFVNQEGIIRAADKNGAPANENDPPINQ